MSGRVLLVEDHAAVAQGLAIALRADGFEVEVAGAASMEGILATARQLSPDAVLLDLHLGELLGDTVPLIPQLRATGARVVMFTAEVDAGALGSCVEVGADGVLAKSQPLEEVVGALRKALSGEPLLTGARRTDLLDAAHQARSEARRRGAAFEALTRREQEVLAAMMDGHSAEAIAERKYVSITTVRSHIRSVLAKLGVGSQLQAVALARRAGWLPPQD